MEKSALLIKARVSGQACELTGVASTLSAAGILPLEVDLTDLVLEEPMDHLAMSLMEVEPVDLVYVCGARGDEWFGDEQIGLSMNWQQLSMILCSNTKPGATVFLAAGNSGLASVSHALFYGCTNVDLVVAPKFDATWRHNMTAASTYLHHRFSCGSDPDTAVSAASVAAHTTYQYRDRATTVETLEYRMYASEQDVRLGLTDSDILA